MAAANDRRLPPPTRVQLEMAYRHMARPGWPSLDDALQVHHYRVCLTGLARRLGRPAFRSEGTARPGVTPFGVLTPPPVPPTPELPPVVARARLGLKPDGSPRKATDGLGSWTRTRPAEWIDVKRLAANDVD